MANQSDPEGAKGSFLNVEVFSQNDKARWVQAAQMAHLSFPEWVNDRLNQAARIEVPMWNQSSKKNA